jgi:hypothetical protein
LIAPIIKALHELGHAAVALAIGAQVCSVRIRDRGGSCRTRDRRHPPREAALRDCMVLFGGIIASECAGSSHSGCSGDFADIRRALDTIEDPNERENIERRARLLAEWIVNERWLDLCRAAEVLAERRRLIE